MTPNGRRGELLAELIKRQSLRVVVGGFYSLQEAASAFGQSMSGQATGKLLIRLV